MVLEADNQSTTPKNGEVQAPGTQPATGQGQTTLDSHPATTTQAAGTDNVCRQPPAAGSGGDVWDEYRQLCFGPQPQAFNDAKSDAMTQSLLGFNPDDTNSWSNFWALEGTTPPVVADTSNLPAQKLATSNGLDVSVKKDSSGRVVDVNASTGDSTTELTTAGVKTTSPKGTIMTDGHGSVIDKSKDGDHVYQRTADGEQRYSEKDGISTKYDAKKKEADVTMPGNTGDSERLTPEGSWKNLNGKQVFVSSQKSSDFDKKGMKDDQVYMFQDGVAMVKHDNNYYMYSKDGHEEVRTKAGKFVIDHDQGHDQIKFFNRHHKDGVTVTNNNVAKIQGELAADGVHQQIVHHGADGHAAVEQPQPAGGVKIDNKPKDEVTVTVPDADKQHDTATIHCKQGAIETDVPNQYRIIDTPQGEQAYDERPGHQDQPLFNYSWSGSDTGTFWTPDITFNSDGSTDLGWDGTSINSSGGVDPGDSYDSYSDLTQMAQSDASADASAADTTADTVDASVDNDVASNTVDVSDLNKVDGAEEQVWAAIRACTATGNLKGLGDLYDDMAALDADKGDMAGKLEKAELARSMGVNDPYAISAMEQDSGATAQQAVQTQLKLMYPELNDDNQALTA